MNNKICIGCGNKIDREDPEEIFCMKCEKLHLKEVKKDKRKIWMRNYQREHHRKPHMVKYMKDYHNDPINKARAKKLRNTPEQKEKDKISSKKWRDSAKGKAWMKKYRIEHIEQSKASGRKYYHKNKNVKEEYHTAHSEERKYGN